MAKITTYDSKALPVAADKLIGTDAADDTTKNFTLSAILQAIGAVTAAPVENLVQNPFFDNPLQNPWTGIIERSDQRWYSGQTAYYGYAGTDPTVFYTGYQSLRIAARGAGAFTIVSQFVPVAANTAYVVSSYIKTALNSDGSGATDGKAYINTWYVREDGTAASANFGQHNQRTGATDWTQNTEADTSPADAAYLRVDLVFNDAAAGYAWFDAVDVRSGAVAPTYTAGVGPFVLSGTFKPERIELEAVLGTAPFVIYLNDSAEPCGDGYTPILDVLKRGDERFHCRIDKAGNIWTGNTYKFITGSKNNVSGAHIYQDAGAGTYGTFIIELASADGMILQHQNAAKNAYVVFMQITNVEDLPVVQWRNNHDHVWYSDDGVTEKVRVDTSEGEIIMQGDTMRLATSRTPASATASGNAGDICWDANYVYVCVATNTWKRAALSTW
jgi:hypothetical protein